MLGGPVFSHGKMHVLDRLIRLHLQKATVLECGLGYREPVQWVGEAIKGRVCWFFKIKGNNDTAA